MKCFGILVPWVLKVFIDAHHPVNTSVIILYFSTRTNVHFDKKALKMKMRLFGDIPTQ